MDTPPSIPAPAPAQAIKLPPRESGWGSVFLACGILGLMAGAFGVFMIVMEEQIGVTVAIVGLLAGLQSFFVAFLINLLTDMRWYLAKINAAQKNN